jgi:hypothetical protein
MYKRFLAPWNSKELKTPLRKESRTTRREPLFCNGSSSSGKSYRLLNLRSLTVTTPKTPSKAHEIRFVLCRVFAHHV